MTRKLQDDLAYAPRARGFEARRVIAMSKGKWPTPAVIKRAIEAVQRSGLSVSGARVSDDSIFVETATRKEPPASASSTNEPAEL